jgi:hypothetical protein
MVKSNHLFCGLAIICLLFKWSFRENRKLIKIGSNGNISSFLTGKYGNRIICYDLNFIEKSFLIQHVLSLPFLFGRDELLSWQLFHSISVVIGFFVIEISDWNRFLVGWSGSFCSLILRLKTFLRVDGLCLTDGLSGALFF